VEFVPQNELERLFLAASADASARPAYYRAFLEGGVIIMDANPPERTPTGAGDLRIRTLQIEGVTHLPVFTSMARVEAYGYREGHCLEIRTRALLEAVPATPVIVNPGSPYYMGLSRQAACSAATNPTGARSRSVASSSQR
jgi:SseB protein N-terminal domain